MRAAFVCMIATLLLATSAMADPVSDFGLTGEWAVDCSKPPAPDNPHWTVAISGGGHPTRKLQMNSRFDGTFEMKDASPLGSERLSYVVTDTVGTYTIVVGKVGSQFRSMESTRHSDGKVLIQDGKITQSGKPTPLFTKCQTN